VESKGAARIEGKVIGPVSSTYPDSEEKALQKNSTMLFGYMGASRSVFGFLSIFFEILGMTIESVGFPGDHFSVA
jgi:hypothetical protein